MVHGSGRFERETTLRQLATPTLWIMGDRDGNLPLPETLRALAALPARNSGRLTLVRFAEADHEMCRPDGSRVDFWKTIEGGSRHAASCSAVRQAKGRTPGTTAVARRTGGSRWQPWSI